MSLTSALNMAKSGLGVTSTRADIVSRNIANADSEGYVRKTAEVVTSRNGGAQVAGIDRQVDSMITKLDRANTSRLAAQRQIVDGMATYVTALGQPNEKISPAAYMSDLNTALAGLTLDPDSSASQQSVLTAAENLTTSITGLSDLLSDIGREVENSISLDVMDLNAALRSIASINADIAGSKSGSISAAERADELDRILDEISGYMDIQIRSEPDGTTSVFTSGGTELVLGDDAMPVSYDRNAGTLFAGTVEITPNPTTRGFSSGSLAGLFTMRNDILPSWSADLDMIAGGLIEASGRLAEIGVGSGVGLFTDAGGAYDPAEISGIAGRLSINAAVDPARGGSLGVIQSGLRAGVEASDTSFVEAMITTLNTPPQVTLTNGNSSDSLMSLISSVVTSHQSQRVDAESALERIGVSARTTASSRSSVEGVNTDEELQNLLAIERSYAANAKIISAVSGMLDDLMAAV